MLKKAMFCFLLSFFIIFSSSSSIENQEKAFTKAEATFDMRDPFAEGNYMLKNIAWYSSVTDVCDVFSLKPNERCLTTIGIDDVELSNCEAIDVLGGTYSLKLSVFNYSDS